MRNERMDLYRNNGFPPNVDGSQYYGLRGVLDENSANKEKKMSKKTKPVQKPKPNKPVTLASGNQRPPDPK